jgi:hypothetical protein
VREWGGRIVFLINVPQQDAVAIRGQFPEDMVVGYDLRRPKEYSSGLKEVEDAWILRDEGYHSVYVTSALWNSGLDDVLGPTSVLRAIKAKACHWLADPLDYIQNSCFDGAKETLGELLM